MYRLQIKKFTIVKSKNQIGGSLRTKPSNKSQSHGQKSEKKEIYFIRHGETDWNVEGRSQGQEADIPLNPNGKKQASITGKYLNDFRQENLNFDCILTSPMNRAYNTAKIIGKEIGFEKKSIIKIKELVENKAGILSGLTDKDKIKKTFSDDVSAIINNIKDPIEKYELDEYKKADDFFTPIIGDYGLETGDELLERINKVIKYIKETKCNKIIIVSHSSFLSSLLKTIFSINTLPKGDMSKSKNCWICYCTYEDNKFHMISPMNTEHYKLYD
jgi:broad specificity phosphatase PhoE